MIEINNGKEKKTRILGILLTIFNLLSSANDRKIIFQLYRANIIN